MSDLHYATNFHTVKVMGKERALQTQKNITIACPQTKLSWLEVSLLTIVSKRSKF